MQCDRVARLCEIIPCIAAIAVGKTRKTQPTVATAPGRCAGLHLRLHRKVRVSSSFHHRSPRLSRQRFHKARQQQLHRQLWVSRIPVWCAGISSAPSSTPARVAKRHAECAWTRTPQCRGLFRRPQVWMPARSIPPGYAQVCRWKSRAVGTGADACWDGYGASPCGCRCGGPWPSCLT